MTAFTLWRRGRRAFRVTRAQLATALLVGVLLPGSNALLFVAERRVPSGVASLIVGAVPLWLVLMRIGAGDRPPGAALGAVLLGFVGVALLVHPGGRTPLSSLLLVVAASLSWAIGSFLSSRLPLPRDALASTSLEMLAGGAFLLPIGMLATHPHFAAISGRSAFGWVYLVTFGSIVGYTAYVWLLDNAPLGTVATYAYVNPLVAIALGALVLHERPGWAEGAGAALVLACVAVVVRHEASPPEARAPAAVASSGRD